MTDPVTEECDHDWEEVDESFDHEFGCEQVYYRRCKICDATTDSEYLGDPDEYDGL
jgi:hypothetical protein